MTTPTCDMDTWLETRESRVIFHRTRHERFTVLILVLVPAQGPNKEWPGPQPCYGMPCAVATRAHAILSTLLSASRGLEYLCGVQWSGMDRTRLSLAI